MVHSSYSQVLAPTALKLAISDTEFENEEDVKSFLDNFILSMPRDFWMKEIKTFPEKWQTLTDNEVYYLLS